VRPAALSRLPDGEKIGKSRRTVDPLELVARHGAGVVAEPGGGWDRLRTGIRLDRGAPLLPRLEP
jgi:hypothetical protein